MELSDTKAVLEELFQIPFTTLEDRRLVKRICELIGTRAARLSAAGIAAIVTKINRLDDCTVAIDGSLFVHYPHFANRMRDALHELVGITAENINLVQGASLTLLVLIDVNVRLIEIMNSSRWIRSRSGLDCCSVVYFIDKILTLWP